MVTPNCNSDSNNNSNSTVAMDLTVIIVKQTIVKSSCAVSHVKMDLLRSTSPICGVARLTPSKSDSRAHSDHSPW